MVQYVESYSVTYSETAGDEPYDVIKEINGGSSDFNKNHKGKYVWITPNWTTARDFAIGGLNVVTSHDPLPNLPDLAIGAGGLYRYLVKQQGSPNKVTQLGLFRSGEPYTSPPQGWNGISTDFNIKRGGDYLYVV